MTLAVTADANAAPRQNLGFWIGRGLSTLAVLFLIFDIAIKFTGLPVVQEAQTQLGYPGSTTPIIAIIELCCLALYLFPRTSILGAVLFTGVFGGAIASHLRVGDPLFSHTLFGVYLGLMLWGGLWLRDAKLRALLPFKR